MHYLLAPLLLLGHLVHAQYIFGHGAQFSEGPARTEVEAEFTYIDVDPPCEISMIIGVDRNGKVVSAEVEKGPDACIETTVLGKAFRSVHARVFNAAPDVPNAQQGTIHWSYHQPGSDRMDVVAMPDEIEEDHQVYDGAKVEQAPEFPGGKAALDKYILMSLRYPEDAMTAKKEGVVLISFIVEKDGKLSTFTLEKGMETSLNQEAMRVMLRMPHWLPGMHNGRQVRARVNCRSCSRSSSSGR